MLASYLQARKDFRQESNNRSFRKVPGQGEKGSGPRPKPPPGGAARPGGYTRQVNDVMKRHSRCGKCGRFGHWGDECVHPPRSKEQRLKEENAQRGEKKVGNKVYSVTGETDDEDAEDDYEPN